MTETIVRPSRRSFVRAAAWTVPVVSVAATAPAFALTTTSSISSGTPSKWSDALGKHVSWDLTLNNGPKAIDTVSITFVYTPNGGGKGSFTTLTVYGYTPTDMTWGKTAVSAGSPYTVTATHAADIAPNTVTDIHTDIYGSAASDGTVSATATIKYVGIATPVQVPVGGKGYTDGAQHLGH